jgi:Xaa-Pro aminopeptidase
MSGLQIMQARHEEAASNAETRLSALRAHLKSLGLNGFIVPKSDEFQNESVPPHADRLAWLTGFTGSAGVAVVLEDKAGLLADSRYTLQAKAQADPAFYSIELFPAVTIASYLRKRAASGAVVGYDLSLHTLAGFKPVREAASKAGITLQPCVINPVDAIWRDRPAPSYKLIVAHEENFAGESAASKLARVQQAIQEKNCAGLFISEPESVAWLFNIRGRDVAHTPVALVRAFVPVSGKPVIFVAPGHITPQNERMIEGLAAVHGIENLGEALSTLIPKDALILADPGRTTLHIADLLTQNGAKLLEEPDPCELFKAKKNSVELQGARNAHRRDGAALTRFLAWLDKEAPSGLMDEIAASDRLEAFRRETNLLEDLSFDTISGAGSNGAIVHYRATPESNKRLEPGSLYLVDSGAQYKDGTTDVTRTVAIGTPAPEMQRHFTLVLKGHISIATARFPAGTRGADIDAFARRALWSAGLDYGHGTGHGVGSFLSVHEGPQRIARNSMVPLEPGMIVSNEPGYYREGQYGIRIENLLAVNEAEPVEGGEIAMISFETLTLAPFDRRLVALDLLSEDEIGWLDAYHARVRRELAPLLNEDDRFWLEAATRPLRS